MTEKEILDQFGRLVSCFKHANGNGHDIASYEREAMSLLVSLGASTIAAVHRMADAQERIATVLEAHTGIKTL